MWHKYNKHLNQGVPLIAKDHSAGELICLNLRDDESGHPSIIPIHPNLMEDGLTFDEMDGEETESIDIAIRLLVQMWVVVEKIVDILLVFFFTGIAINWLPMYDLIRLNFWPLICSIPILTILMFMLRRVIWITRWPGCVIIKLIYLLHRIVVLVLFVHLERFLYWYVCMIVAGTEATTLMLFVIDMRKSGSTSRYFWEYRVIMPIVVLVTSQPVYFFAGIAPYMEYGMYMIEIGTVVVISLLLSYQPVLIFRMFSDTPSPPEDNGTKSVTLPDSVPAHTLQFNENVGKWEIVNL